MPRLLVMEGNPKARRDITDAFGLRSNSEIYRAAIQAHFPAIALDIINAADRDAALPHGTSLTDYDGLVVGGSGLHAYDTTFEVTNQIDLLRAFAATGKPILGSCWGLQIAVIAAGGTVGLSPRGREIGIARKLCLTEAGTRHPLFAGKARVFDAPCIHYDEITALPADATPLCGNAHSPVQAAAFRLDRAEIWAVQYHPEFDLAHVAGLFALYADDLIKQGFFAAKDMLEDHRRNLLGLADDPGNRGLAWQLSLDADILDDRIRRAEIINWVERQILGS